MAKVQSIFCDGDRSYSRRLDRLKALHASWRFPSLPRMLRFDQFRVKQPDLHNDIGQCVILVFIERHSRLYRELEQ